MVCLEPKSEFSGTFLRQRLSFQTPARLIRCVFRYDSARHVLVSTWQKDGLKGLFRGWVPTLFKVAPAAGISFGAYSAINDRFSSLRRQHIHANVSRAEMKK